MADKTQVEVPFFWTQHGLYKYLEQYYFDIVKAIESRGRKMKQPTQHFSNCHGAESMYEHCSIMVECSPLTVLSVGLDIGGRSGWNSVLLWIHDDVWGFPRSVFRIEEGNFYDMIRKRGSKLPFPQELADEILRQADLFEQTIKTIKQDRQLLSLSHRIWDNLCNENLGLVKQDEVRLVKLLQKKGIKIPGQAALH